MKPKELQTEKNVHSRTVIQPVSVKASFRIKMRKVQRRWRDQRPDLTHNCLLSRTRTDDSVPVRSCTCSKGHTTFSDHRQKLALLPQASDMLDFSRDN